MPLATEIIGTGETYTTIQAWEDAIDGTKQHTGKCKAEAFSKATFSSETYDSSNYPHLTAQSGAEHDGRAHEVSGAGNARIEYDGDANLLSLGDPYMRVSWLELEGPGDNNKAIINYTWESGTYEQYVHHCILHNNHANTDGNLQRGIFPYMADAVYKLYRNVIYGTCMCGIKPNAGGANSALLCSTIYECGTYEAQWTGGITTNDADFAIQCNACFDNPDDDIKGTAGTLDYNATSDGTGDDEGEHGLANLVTADQFVNPTTTWANTDLLVKAGAGLIDEGTSFSAVTYPEIDVAIDKGATRATIAGTWDIGAGELAVAGVTLTPDPATTPLVAAATAVKFTLTPDPAAAPMVAAETSVAFALTPDPAAAALASPGASIAFTVKPDSAATTIAAPQVTTLRNFKPDVVPMPIVVPTGCDVTGDPSPDCTGRFFEGGEYAGKPFYANATETWFIWWHTVAEAFYISAALGGAHEPTDPYWASQAFDIKGDYKPFGTASGTATVNYTAAVKFTLKADATAVPLAIPNMSIAFKLKPDGAMVTIAAPQPTLLRRLKPEAAAVTIAAPQPMVVRPFSLTPDPAATGLLVAAVVLIGMAALPTGQVYVAGAAAGEAFVAGSSASQIRSAGVGEGEVV